MAMENFGYLYSFIFRNDMDMFDTSDSDESSDEEETECYYEPAVRTESQSRILQLLDLAISFINDRGDNVMEEIQWFYRNKPAEYFQEIVQSGRRMAVYLKDPSGDQQSPINGRLKGLFFAVHVDPKTGKPPKTSPFGNCRLSIPASRMFQGNKNLYITDFYCKADRSGVKPHYVTLVMTTDGSKADRFCQENLIELDVENNPFLTYDQDDEEVCVTSNVLVEVMYTDNIHVGHMLRKCGATLTTVMSRGQSSPQGVLKDETCPYCNP